ncbi:fibronectin type III domain protein [Rhodococcus sp. OK519]|uniref:fibronectin type III domain-containing protein n=1 Tax=Rhodococcus sp. OK519 TaxID=2135729 RepID=UPI000D3936A2|nr:fibronectin type III domain protein [Rhodococcus sp. OK519]
MTTLERTRQIVAFAAAAAVLSAAGACSADSGGSSAPPESSSPPVVTESFLGLPSSYVISDVTDMFDAPYGIAASPDGNYLYISGGNGPRASVARITGDLDHVTWLDPEESGFDLPGQISVAPDGTVYVVNRGNNSISIGSGERWRTVPASQGRFDSPEAAVGLADGTVFVTNTGNSTVSVSHDGGATWVTVGSDTGHFAAPTAAAASDAGEVFVANAGDGSLSVTRDAGRSWDSIPADRTGLGAPHSMAVGPAGEIYVTDHSAGTLTRSLDGGRTWSTDGGFDNIWGVTVADDGALYLTDAINTAVEVHSTAGTATGLTATWSTPGTLAVNWKPAPNTGGSAVRRYAVTAEPDFTEEQLVAFLSDRKAGSPEPSWTVETDTASGSTAIEGLPPGIAVDVTVVAVNDAGFGDPLTVRVDAR